jgi:hypothetical protein
MQNKSYKRIVYTIIILSILIFTTLISGCSNESTNFVEIESRHDKIPNWAVKMMPNMDQHPPVLHSNEFEEPVPLAIINTAGAEDSPFIPIDRDELYFFFTKDAKEEVHIQIRDPINGIWMSKMENGAWQEPELVLLQKKNKLALNGCEFVQSDTMLFCTAREGYTGLHWFSAKYLNDKWTNWKINDFNLEYEVGELHIHGEELYYHSSKAGGKGETDIWRLELIENEWKNPTNIAAVNTDQNEGMPYITPDGQELWFNRWHMGSPAVFRSKKVNGEWQNAEMIVSSFAGEPTLDKYGNLYFVHHFYENSEMIEADIYIAYKK